MKMVKIIDTLVLKGKIEWEGLSIKDRMKLGAESTVKIVEGKAVDLEHEEIVDKYIEILGRHVQILSIEVLSGDARGTILTSLNDAFCFKETSDILFDVARQMIRGASLGNSAPA